MAHARRPAPKLLPIRAAVALLVLLGAPAFGQSPAPSSAPAATIATCTALAEAPATTTAPVAAASASPTPATGDLTVFAAASLKNAFEAFAPAFTAESGLTPVHAFDASSALRAQIEEGAPADVFASADLVNVRKLLDAGLAQDPVAFACNQLTIIVPAGNPAGITSAADLGRAGVTVIAAGPEVPITKYAAQLVENLGITEAYTANVVSEEDNVAAIRARIEAGEGDAGIVYVTDAIASGATVEQIAVPVEANVAATYAAATVIGTDQPDEAAAYLAFLVGPEGQATLAAYGFIPAPTSGP